MIRRALTVLLVALATACASAAGFTEAPHTEQLAFLLGACVFAATLQMVAAQAPESSKKGIEYQLIQSPNHILAAMVGDSRESRVPW
jgi:hypothetical protein